MPASQTAAADFLCIYIKDWFSFGLIQYLKKKGNINIGLLTNLRRVIVCVRCFIGQHCRIYFSKTQKLTLVLICYQIFCLVLWTFFFLKWDNFFKIHSFPNQIKTWLNAEFLHNLHIWYFQTFECYIFISSSFFKIHNNFLDAPVCKQDAAQKILGISYKKPATILCEVMVHISLAVCADTAQHRLDSCTKATHQHQHQTK